MKEEVNKKLIYAKKDPKIKNLHIKQSDFMQASGGVKEETLKPKEPKEKPLSDEEIFQKIKKEMSENRIIQACINDMKYYLKQHEGELEMEDIISDFTTEIDNSIKQAISSTRKQSQNRIDKRIAEIKNNSGGEWECCVEELKKLKEAV